MSLNDSRCPYCFSKFEDAKWTDDPLLTKNGSSFVYDEDTGLLIPQPDPVLRLYKGCTVVKNQHIIELQEANDDNKPSPDWTPVKGEANGYWTPNKIHIKELRDAIEKGLGITESTSSTERTTILEQYFNYDEDGTERQNPHQMDWNDPTLTGTVWMGNISHMHIEDLRKTLSLNWMQKYWLGVNPPLSQPNYQYISLKETLISGRKNLWRFMRGCDETLIGSENIIIFSGTGGITASTSLDYIKKITKNTILNFIYTTTGGSSIPNWSNDGIQLHLYIGSLSPYLKYSSHITPYDVPPFPNIVPSGSISRNIYNDIVLQFPTSPLIAQMDAGIYPNLNKVEFWYQSNTGNPTNGSITSIEVI